VISFWAADVASFPSHLPSSTIISIFLSGFAAWNIASSSLNTFIPSSQYHARAHQIGAITQIFTVFD
jgi:hypothetical protein